MDSFKDFDFTKTVLFVIPGVLFALFRSFTIRGVFPVISKDDIAALIIISIIYHFLLISSLSDSSIDFILKYGGFATFFAALITIIIPSISGVVSGVIEAGDVVGKVVRATGFTFRSPTQTAWETLFTELKGGSFLMITLKDDSLVYGRWVKGSRLSAASTDVERRDLFIAEIGGLNSANKYLPQKPPRGIYISADEIRLIEVV